MEVQKIINLLESSDDEQYEKGDENDSTIIFNSEIIKSYLCDYSDAYIFFQGDIAVVGRSNNTKICFKNDAPFTRCVTHLNYEHVETAENLNLVMNLYNLIEYSDNCQESTASLWQYKRD